jgi:tetratricopeptide (TPR) repeat protein
LDHLPDSREKIEWAIDLRFELRNALWALGALRRILDVLHEAEALAEALGEPRRMGLAALYLCTSFYGAAEHDRAVAAGERALAHSQLIDDLDLRILASSHLGQAHVARTDYRRAAEILEGTVALLEGRLLRERFGQGTLPSVLSRVNLIRCLAEFGRFDEAIERSEEAIGIAEAVDHPASLLLAQWAHGLVHVRRGDVVRAIAAMEASLQLSREAGLPVFVHWAGPWLGAAYALAGRPTEAVALLERVLEQDVALNVMSQNNLTVAYLAEAHWLAGHAAEAADLAARAFALSRERSERGYQAWVHRLHGELGSRQEPWDPVSAATSYQKALGLAEELGMRPLEAHCHLGLGRLHRRTGDRAAAKAQLARAATMYHEMGMRLWLDQVDAEVATKD